MTNSVRHSLLGISSSTENKILVTGLDRKQGRQQQTQHEPSPQQQKILLENPQPRQPASQCTARLGGSAVTILLCLLTATLVRSLNLRQTTTPCHGLIRSASYCCTYFLLLSEGFSGGPVVSPNGLLNRCEAVRLEEFCELLLNAGHSAGAPVDK